MKPKLKIEYIFLALIVALTGCIEEPEFDDKTINTLSNSYEVSFSTSDSVNLIADNETYHPVYITLVDQTDENYSYLNSTDLQITIHPTAEFQNGDTIQTSSIQPDSSILVLIKASQPGLKLLTAIIGDYEYSHTLLFEKAPHDTTFSDAFTTTISGSIADSISPATISINMTDSGDSVANLDIIAITDLGFFSNGLQTIAQKAGSDGNVQFQLLSDQVGTANVQITAGNSQDFATVGFTESMPQYVVLNADKQIISVPDTVNLDALLKRYTGKINYEHPVQFKQVTSSSVPVGDFSSNYVTTSNLTTTTQFVLQDTSYAGTLTIEAEVLLSSGSAIKGQVFFNVVK